MSVLSVGVSDTVGKINPWTAGAVDPRPGLVR